MSFERCPYDLKETERLRPMIVFRLPSNVFVAVKNTKPFVPSGYSDLPEFTCHLNQKKCKEVNVYRVYTSSTNRNKAMHGHRERTVKLDKSANIVMAILSPFQNVIHLMER